MGADVILHDKSGEQVHVLNPTAYFIWRRCDGRLSIEELIAEMRSEFSSIPDEQIQSDVEASLQLFSDNGMLKA